MQAILKFIYYHYLLNMLIVLCNNLEIAMMTVFTGWLTIDWSWMLIKQSFLLLLAHRGSVKT